MLDSLVRKSHSERLRFDPLLVVEASVDDTGNFEVFSKITKHCLDFSPKQRKSKIDVNQILMMTGVSIVSARAGWEQRAMGNM